jgi:Flp pilus assembly protein TadG
MLPTLAARFPAVHLARGGRRLKGEGGAELLEYSVVFTFLVTMLLGIANFGGALYAYHFVSHAARQATRWAAVNGYTCAKDNTCAAPASATDIQNYVTNLAPWGIDTSKLTTTASWPTQSGSPEICTQAVNGFGPFYNYPGCSVQVQVSYTSTLNFPVYNKSLTLSSTSQMVIVH